ncbi:GNAT family N-acetyltransferase [Cardiobacterium hominis]|jgi:acetyltransferase|uniref:GNAT family N-acetyltransferase n=1 Tax=Cardiobacterium hominis TaxID=2718 RepID=UPI0024927B18|nr:GNAT family N-acetyltransferase [Cardiobacterium hominis]
MLTYRTNHPVSRAQFIALLQKTSLGARRPLAEAERIDAMLQNADLLISAWDDDRLVGIARAVTDYAYCCYLSDLAVDEAWQRRGIGQELLATLKQALHPQCKIILLAAPQATDYYPHIGFTQHPSAWTKV